MERVKPHGVDEQQCTEGIWARKATSSDVRGLTALISSQGGAGRQRQLFGSYNLATLVESSYLTVVAGKQGNVTEGEYLGFLVLADTPCGIWSSASSEVWLEWYNDAYAPSDSDARPSNTLWVDFMVSASNMMNSHEIVERMIRSVFGSLPDLDYIIMGLPDSALTTEWGSQFRLSTASAFADLASSPLASQSPEEEKVGESMRVLMCDRSAFLPTLAVRIACVEDHDDLIPIFEEQNDLLKEHYGEFFLADMIESQDAKNRAVVSLAEHHACGLVAVSSDIDLALLQQCFQLERFEHLVKLPEDVRAEIVAKRRHHLGLDAHTAVEHDGEPISVPTVLVLGPPCSGRSTLSMALAEELDLVLVSVDAEAKRAASQGDSVGERALKLLHAGEELPVDLTLDLLGPALASMDCQKRGWVLEGIGLACDMEELEEAIVMATAMGQEHDVATRPDLVISLEASDDEILDRCRRESSSGEDESGRTASILDRVRAHRMGIDDQLATFCGLEMESAGETVTEKAKADGGALGCVEILNSAQGEREILAAALAAFHKRMRAKMGADDDEAHGAAAPGLEAACIPPSEKYASMPSNAFAITLACIEDVHASRSGDFLPHLFALFPELDYCILTIPCHASGAADAPLLRKFSAVPPRPGSTFSHSLYVLHRDTLAATKLLKVLRYDPMLHKGGAQRLVEYWDSGDEVMAALHCVEPHRGSPLAENPPQVAFVAMLGQQLVGLAVLDRMSSTVDKIGELRSTYEVDALVHGDRVRPRSFAQLQVLVVAPVISDPTMLLKETLRLYNKTVLYWEQPVGTRAPEVVVLHMNAVQPRPLTRRLDSSLYLVSKRDLPEAKRRVNRRIVVVGASTCGLSFMRSLLYTPHLSFTNVTLISPGGLNCAGRLEPCDPESFHRDFVDPILETHVRIIESRMVDLDRENKAILLPDGSIVPYDTLVLTTGKQEQSSTRLRIWRRGDHAANPRLKGFVSVDSAVARDLISSGLKAEYSGVIVSGHGLRAHMAIKYLLDSGVSGKQITIVQSQAENDVTGHFLDGLSVREAADSVLEGQGITVIRNGHLVDVKIDDNDTVTGAILCDEAGNTTEIPCALLIGADVPGVDPDIFHSVNDNGLVYDAGLVVDFGFRTVDPDIYGGGTLTRFSTAWSRVAPSHDFCSSTEIGEHLSQSLKVDVGLIPMQEDLPHPPVLNRPRGVSVMLPNDIHYTCASCPMLESDTRKMRMYSTGNTESQNFCTICVDALDQICKLTYYGKDELNETCLLKIVGVHQAYVKDVIRALANDEVKDIGEFLRNGCELICHDRFGNLVKRLRQELSSNSDIASELLATLEDGVRSGQDEDWVRLSINKVVGKGGSALPTSTIKLIQNQAADFIHDNRDLLPPRFAA